MVSQTIASAGWATEPFFWVTQKRFELLLDGIWSRYLYRLGYCAILSNSSCFVCQELFCRTGGTRTPKCIVMMLLTLNQPCLPFHHDPVCSFSSNLLSSVCQHFYCCWVPLGRLELPHPNRVAAFETAVSAIPPQWRCKVYVASKFE